MQVLDSIIQSTKSGPDGRLGPQQGVPAGGERGQYLQKSCARSPSGGRASVVGLPRRLAVGDHFLCDERRRRKGPPARPQAWRARGAAPAARAQHIRHGSKSEQQHGLRGARRLTWRVFELPLACRRSRRADGINVMQSHRNILPY